MTDFAFNCPWCDQHLEAPPDMVGEVIACPSCEKELKVPAPTTQSRPKTRRMPMPDPAPRFPIIVRSSTRALYAKYIWHAIGWTFGLILVIAMTWLLNALEVPGAGIVVAWVWGFFLLLLVISLIRLWFDYRRIKHTEYRIFRNKIETVSYLFRFLGAYNNIVNLAQLRQIQASSNTMFDLWFFKCGKVTLTVSGDASDFEMKNVYRPSLVRKQVEEIAFGKESVQHGAGPTLEVDDGD